MGKPKTELLSILRETPLKHVRSEAVRKFGYAPDARMAAVVFTSSDVRYGYPNLDDEEVRGLLDVLEHEESLGHFVSTVIKPNHDHERVQI